MRNNPCGGGSLVSGTIPPSALRRRSTSWRCRTVPCCVPQPTPPVNRLRIDIGTESTTRTDRGLHGIVGNIKKTENLEVCRRFAARPVLMSSSRNTELRGILVVEIAQNCYLIGCQTTNTASESALLIEKRLRPSAPNWKRRASPAGTARIWIPFDKRISPVRAEQECPATFRIR